ncbi:MAG: ketoacyl-ACP synthase III [Ruminococcaceae bacterium]|nr:ketoacyl-ACP synthase III [Oscillospiraceae bacterium]
MSTTISPRARIAATGSYIPDFRLTNDALSRMVETNDEWIRERTGIAERRINTTLSNREMAVIAAKRALDASGLDPLDIDIVIASTVTNDNYSPALACYVQADIGASNAFAFDVNAGCSGFVYALDTASAFISAARPGTKPVRHVLIVCSENLSRITDYTDRSSCILFGDGAGAAIVSADDSHGLLSTYIRTDGTGADAITARALAPVIDNGDGTVSNNDASVKAGLVMNGREVYRFAVKAVPEAVEGALAAADLTAADLKYLVMHQANARIIASAVERLGIDPEKAPMNMERYGNTSSASVPILLDELNRAGKLSRGDKLAIAGFGSGLTYGVAIIEW